MRCTESGLDKISLKYQQFFTAAIVELPARTRAPRFTLVFLVSLVALDKTDRKNHEWNPYQSVRQYMCHEFLQGLLVCIPRYQTVVIKCLCNHTVLLQCMLG